MAKPDITPPDAEHFDNARTTSSNGGSSPNATEERRDIPVGNEHGEVVYRRVSPAPQNEAPNNIRARAREIAPTITPLIIGFTLLLALVFLLGYLSVRRMDDVSFNALDLERQHAARLGLLLQLRLAVNQLNNEARARHNSESRGELKPPFDFRLSTTREEVARLHHELERPPLTDDPTWTTLRNDLQSFIDVTEDLRRYSLEGFSRFSVVDNELNTLLAQSAPDQEQVIAKSTALEEQAARSIRAWTIFAILFGGIVAAGTIWEVQRRFRQMRTSMMETQRERTFTTQLLEGMVSAVVAIDHHDRIRSANAAFFKIFPGASIGASIREKFGNDDAMKMLEAATSTFVDVATYRGRWVFKTDSDGAEKTYDVYSSPWAINEESGQILTLVDATVAAEGERVLRRSESLAAVGRATTQVAHEIRNPLGSIRLGVSMLRDSVNDDDALRTIELVERGIKHLNKLVVDVMQFSRQKALERAEVDLHDLLDRSLDLVADRVKEKHTPVEKRFTRQKLIGQWDADQLRQVFVNVMANAIDASPEQAPLRIMTQTVSVDGSHNGGTSRNYAQITIADQGEGLDKPTADRIFEPFFSTKKRGTGLGLAIVKQIVEQHGGRITVESEPGKGARFTIDLPL